MRHNRYLETCGRCGTLVGPGEGMLSGQPGRWRVWCLACRPLPPPRGSHRGWHELPLASLDFETTGVDPAVDRVISYALLDDDGTDAVGLIDPGVPIPEAASAVHGITVEGLRGAPASVEGIATVLAWVTSLIDRGLGLVVFNAPYDLTMLAAEARRWGLPEPDWARLLVVDPWVVDWGIERGALGPRRLVDVAEYYGIAMDNAHDADCDARAARDVAREISARHPHVGTLSLPELTRWQRHWYRERAESWNAYAREADRPLEDPAGWPILAPAGRHIRTA